MRILAFILSVFVSTVLITGGAFLMVFAAPPHDDWTVVLGTVALSMLIYGPLTLGSMTAYWDFRGDDANRRLLRRSYLIIGLIEVASVAAIVVYTVVNGSPWWLPVLFGAGAAVLTVVASRIGPALLRRDAATRKETPDWIPVTHAQIVRKVITVAITFGAFLVIGIVGTVILFGTTGHGFDRVGGALALAVGLAFIAGGFACVLVALPLNRLLRESTGRNLALLRKVAKVVLRGKAIDLNANERIAAVKYAEIVSITLPFQLAYIAMLYIGIAIQQVQQLSSDTDSFSLFILIGLVVVLIIVFPMTVMRIAKARRYAKDNHRLPEQIEFPSSPSGFTTAN